MQGGPLRSGITNKGEANRKQMGIEMEGDAEATEIAKTRQNVAKQQVYKGDCNPFARKRVS